MQANLMKIERDVKEILEGTPFVINN